MQITFNPLMNFNKNNNSRQSQNIQSANNAVSFQALPNPAMIAKYRYPNQHEILAILGRPKLPVEDIKYLVQESLSLPGLTKTSQIIDKACEVLKGKEEVMLELAGIAFKKKNYEEAAKILGFTAQNYSVNSKGIESLKNLYYTPHPDRSSIYVSILKSLDKFIGVHNTEEKAFDLLKTLFIMHENEVAPLYKKVFLSSIEKAQNPDLVIKYVDNFGSHENFVEHIEPLLLNKRTQKGAIYIFSDHLRYADYKGGLSHYIGLLDRLASSKETADLGFRLIKYSFVSPKMDNEGLNIFRKAAQNPDLKDILFKHLELKPSEDGILPKSLTYPRRGISNILLNLFPEEKYTQPIFEKIRPMFESGNNADKILFYENIGRFLSCSETSDEALKILKEGFEDKHVDIRLSSIDAVVKMLDDEKLFKQADELLWDAIRIDYNMLARNNGVYTLSMPMGIRQTVIKMYDNVTSALGKKPEGIENIKSHAKEYLDLRSELINSILDKKDMVTKSLADIGI